MTFQQAGFLVSRALAVISFMYVLRLLTLLPGWATMPAEKRDMFTVLAMSSQVLEFGGMVFLTLALWFRANRFAPAEGQASARGLTYSEASRLLFSGLGIYLVVLGLAALANWSLGAIFYNSFGRNPFFAFAASNRSDTLLNGIIYTGIGLVLLGKNRGWNLSGRVRRLAEWLWMPPIDSADEEERSEP